MPEHRISYSVREAAKAAGIGLTKLREEIRSSRLVARKLGRRTLINAEDLNAWAANLPRVVSARSPPCENPGAFGPPQGNAGYASDEVAR
jgi:excisionase family DNA binding protein